MRDIKEFLCWQLADRLKREILDLTDRSAFAREFKLRDQIRASSSSATANMEEGFGYFEPAQFARFLGYAVGSLRETQGQLLDALDRKLVDPTLYSRLNNLAGAARRVTTKLKLSKERQAEEQRRDRRRQRRSTMS